MIQPQTFLDSVFSPYMYLNVKALIVKGDHGNDKMEMAQYSYI